MNKQGKMLIRLFCGLVGTIFMFNAGVCFGRWSGNLPTDVGLGLVIGAAGLFMLAYVTSASATEN